MKSKLQAHTMHVHLPLHLYYFATWHHLRHTPKWENLTSFYRQSIQCNIRHVTSCDVLWRPVTSCDVMWRHIWEGVDNGCSIWSFQRQCTQRINGFDNLLQVKICSITRISLLCVLSSRIFQISPLYSYTSISSILNQSIWLRNNATSN